jgi:hypothetical protein
MQTDPFPQTAAGHDRQAAPRGYEVSQLAAKHELTIEQARELIERFGNERTKLDDVVARLKARRNGFWGRMADVRKRHI